MSKDEVAATRDEYVRDGEWPDGQPKFIHWTAVGCPKPPEPMTFRVHASWLDHAPPEHEDENGSNE
jgi:hypothetical protein